MRTLFGTENKQTPPVWRIGFGAWGIGGRTLGNTSYGDTDDAVSRKALRKALTEGVRLFDTSPAYGDGRSEELVGGTLSDYRDQILLCTKVGVETWRQSFNFDVEAIQKSLLNSLRRLKTTYVDILLLHSPPLEVLSDKKLFRALNELVDTGAIRRWGISCKRPNDALAVLDCMDVQIFQVNFNMLDLRALNCGLLDRAADSGIEIVARTPLNFGFLTGAVNEKTHFSDGDHRSAWTREQIASWSAGARKLMAITGTKPGDEACIAAIRFCLSFPSISVVLPGAQTPREVDIHCTAGRLGPLPQDMCNEILAFSNKNTFFLQS